MSPMDSEGRSRPLGARHVERRRALADAHRGRRAEKRLSFLEFLSFVSDQEAHVTLGIILDSHLSPQYRYGEDVCLDFYLPVEDFSKRAPWLEESMAGLRKSDPVILSESGHNRIIDTKAHWGLHPSTFRIGPDMAVTFPPYDKLLKDAGSALDGSAFAEDINRYGRFYSNPTPQRP